MSGKSRRRINSRPVALGCSLQINTQGVHHFDHGFKAGLGTRSESLVQTGTTKPGGIGYLPHATSFCNVANGTDQFVSVTVGKHLSQVFTDGLIAVQQLCHVEGQ